ncbi:MAG: hypothetical protein BMS9Abin29_1907 [Gemmatimonadota bacterium]|nr:MAG: hypothetical protein BMS9Abin29_1907 [Gemmatimonadota bacterium]
MSVLLSIALLALMAGALLTVPLGLPGIWLMLLLLGAAVLFGGVSWMVWLGLVGLGVLAELAEFLVLEKVGGRYGASSKAFWGAVVGGIVGSIIGVPIPIIGPVIAGFLGTFAGAGMVSYLETRSIGDASRVGAGVVLARACAVALKVGTGLLIMVVTVAALLV